MTTKHYDRDNGSNVRAHAIRDAMGTVQVCAEEGNAIAMVDLAPADAIAFARDVLAAAGSPFANGEKSAITEIRKPVFDINAAVMRDDDLSGHDIYRTCANELDAALADDGRKHGDTALAMAYDSGYQAGLLAAKIAIRNLLVLEGVSDEQS
jgi:hypothetical protein